MEIGIDTLKNIIDIVGDTFYLLDTKQFKKNYKELENAFRNVYPKTNLCYSYKTNYIPRLCSIVHEMGGYAETVSDMEIEIAKKVGVPSDKIVFNGPYKNQQAMEKLLLEGGNVNIDSLYDFDIATKLAKKNKTTKIGIGLRCNFDIGDGVTSRFGFDVTGEDFRYVLGEIRNIENLYLRGFHCHFATRSLNTWSNRVKEMLEIVDEFYPKIPEYISLGGGLYGKMKESLQKQFDTHIPTYDEYAKVVADQFQLKYGSNPLGEQPWLFIEPGSALSGDTMKFFSKVVSIKDVRGKKVATVLGSIYNINPTLNTKNPPLTVYKTGKGKRENHKNMDFGGFTCIESDYLYRNYSGELAEGDEVMFDNIGSYSIVLKPPFILPNFPVVELGEKNEVIVIKRQEMFDDLFKTYSFS